MTASSATVDVVDSIKSLRDDYQAKLREIPQYAAFLAVEHARATAAEALEVDATLGIDASSGNISLPSEVVAALTTAHSKFKQQLESVSEYRALLLINKLIGDLSESVEAEPTIEATPLSGLPRDTNYEEKVEKALADETPALSETSGSLVTAAESASEAQALVTETVPATETQPKVAQNEDFPFAAATVAAPNANVAEPTPPLEAAANAQQPSTAPLPEKPSVTEADSTPVVPSEGSERAA
jgi:hypothetical protein